MSKQNRNSERIQTFDDNGKVKTSTIKTKSRENKTNLHKHLAGPQNFKTA